MKDDMPKTYDKNNNYKEEEVKCIQWLIDNPFPPSYYPSKVKDEQK